ncbi:hypothetical protein EV122DRAFT_280065 [Schizophyllum commune]
MEADHATTSSQPPVLLFRDPQDNGDHGSIPGTADRPSTAELVERAIASNHAQKEAVAAQLDRLYSELEQLTDALASVESQDIADTIPEEVEPVTCVKAPGAARPAMYFQQNEFTKKDSPFAADAGERNLYLSLITPNSLSKREMDLLMKEVARDWDRVRAKEANNIQGAKSPVANDAALSLLDWTGITEKFNSSNNQAQKRKQEELRFSYIAAAKYSNKSAWSAKEKAKLHQLIEGYRARNEAVDWAKVSDELGTHRLPMDCMRAAQPRQQFQWTPDKDQLLQQNVLRWGDDNWSTVAFHTSPHLNATQAATRYNRLNQKSGRWSPTEDKRLREAHRLFEGAYMQIATYLEGRTNEQCRDHWNDIKDNPKKRKKRAGEGASQAGSASGTPGPMTGTPGPTSGTPGPTNGTPAPVDGSAGAATDERRPAKRRKTAAASKAPVPEVPPPSSLPAVDLIDPSLRALIPDASIASSSSVPAANVGATASGERTGITVAHNAETATPAEPAPEPKPKRPRGRPRKVPPPPPVEAVNAHITTAVTTRSSASQPTTQPTASTSQPLASTLTQPTPSISQPTASTPEPTMAHLPQSQPSTVDNEEQHASGNPADQPAPRGRESSQASPAQAPAEAPRRSGRARKAVSYAFVAEEEEESEDEVQAPVRKQPPVKEPPKGRGRKKRVDGAAAQEVSSSAAQEASSSVSSAQVEGDSTPPEAAAQPPVSRSGMSIASLLN